MHYPEVTGFFDEATFTISYVVTDPETKKCAVIDSLLDFDQASGRTKTTSADRLIAFVKDQGLTCEWIIDTHVHADHLTAAPYIRDQLGGKTAIGNKIPVVQRIFGEIFNEGQSFHTDGSQFDHLFKPGESYRMLVRSTTPSRCCSTSLTRRECSFATTTRHQGATSMFGKPQLANRSVPTSM